MSDNKQEEKKSEGIIGKTVSIRTAVYSITCAIVVFICAVWYGMYQFIGAGVEDYVSSGAVVAKSQNTVVPDARQ